ncbi:hypothetical protein WP8S17C03_31610 [Metapseudomonas otitidis]|uniref:Uncharacterized protein n=1 Tax=Metapseudomonas otitidis TaxID=319939 RepID=A0A6S5RQK5_9GAMM|nr:MULTISPECIES: hypothetical protein [Pseudomonas]MDU9396838.1 hypothetical protein [Pseudomonas sp. zfem003]BBT17112.1 hypothetical protein WP8S17C03_31610 [Pseudomonas otitidis]
MNPLSAIDYARIQALLETDYVQEHYLRYEAGGDSYDWLELEDGEGDSVELYVEFLPDRFRIAVANESGPGPDNGFDDHRHFIFKLVDAEAQRHELLFQPMEVDGEGADCLDTFPLAEQAPAVQASAVRYLGMLEAYIRAADQRLAELKADLPPDIILNVLGTFERFDALRETFESMTASMGLETFRLDEAFSELEHDDRMPRSYRICADRTEPSMTEEDEAAIEAHTATAYFVMPRIHHERTRIVAAMAAARALGRLIEQGLVTAAKVETAGLAHGLARWKELIDALEASVEARDQRRMLLTLYRLFVRKPIGHENLLYTCGMQHLGLPDFVIRFAEDEEVDLEAQEAAVARFEQAFLAAFGVEPAAEPSSPYLARPDFGYELGDIRHNPFGYTCIGQPAQG